MALSASSKRKKIRFAVVGNRDGLVERVVQAIEARIQTGRLTVGMKLPPEREFSETLGVSRPVVREAVRILTTRGQLKTQHGVGTTVSSVGCNEIVKPLTLFLRTRGEVVNIKHLHQVRSILEVESAGLAAEQRTQDDIEKLTAICNGMEEHANDPYGFFVSRLRISPLANRDDAQSPSLPAAGYRPRDDGRGPQPDQRKAGIVRARDAEPQIESWKRSLQVMLPQHAQPCANTSISRWRFRPS